MNPCRCGGGHGDGFCRKGPRCAEQYQARLSGPFLDRIDLFFDTPPVTAMDLTQPSAQECSADIARRVGAARDAQIERFAPLAQAQSRPLNVDASGDELDQYARPDKAGQALIADAAVQLSLSARAYHRVLKVARTIADLEGCDGVRRVHVAEALSYRRRLPGGRQFSPSKCAGPLGSGIKQFVRA
jgi:magnesium chelatase family protein